MCWSSKTLTKRIATEDIKVFKLVRVISGAFISYYQLFAYDVKRLYKTNIHSVCDHDKYYIFDGFHSYNPKRCRCVKSTVTGQWMVFSDIVFIDGVNSYCRPVECTIPKHSEYYENAFGEIVSNQIIINKIIE